MSIGSMMLSMNNVAIALPLVTEGLVLNLDAGNAASYPGSGTSWTDLSGNDRNGTLTGGPTYSSADGGSIVFDGSNDFVQCLGSLTVTEATFVIWIRRNGPQDDFDGIIYSRSANATGLSFFGTTNKISYTWNNAVDTYTWDSGLTIPDLTWCMIAVSVTSTSATAYLCQAGVITSATNTVSHTSTVLDDVKLAQDDLGGRFFNGRISVAMIYDRALSANEISQNFNSLRGRYGFYITNLVAYYDPSNASSYSGSGTVLNDLSGNGLTGTMSNITYTSPYFSYNGTSSQVSIADNIKLEPGSGSWTMEAWVYLSNTGAGAKTILGKFDPGGGAQDVSYSMRISTANAYAQFGDGTGAYVDSTSYTLTINTWTHIVYVWTNGATKTLQTYINGTSIGSVNHTLSSILNTPSNLYLGSYNGGEYSQWMNGRIGITRLYNAALTGSQVLQNYNADKDKYGL